MSDTAPNSILYACHRLAPERVEGKSDHKIDRRSQLVGEKVSGGLSFNPFKFVVSPEQPLRQFIDACGVRDEAAEFTELIVKF